MPSFVEPESAPVAIAAGAVDSARGSTRANPLRVVLERELAGLRLGSPHAGVAARYQPVAAERAAATAASSRPATADVSPVGWTRKIHTSQVQWLTISAPIGTPAA